MIMAECEDPNVPKNENLNANTSEDNCKLNDKSEKIPLTGTVISEGKAQVRFPGAKDDVFYNPVQEFNRDLR